MSKPQKDDFDAVKTVIEALSDFDPADQERILRWAREKLGLSLQPTGYVNAPLPGANAPAHPAASGATAGSGENATDIKSFVHVKAPSSDVQFVAVIAYYYRFQAPMEVRKDAITADDVLEACRLTGRPRPNKVSQTMVNAHNQGLLDRAEGRGSYAINTVGENLVAITLPAGNAGVAGNNGGRRPTRKKTVKVSKKVAKKAKQR